MPISCHFRDCKSLLVASPTHVISYQVSLKIFYLYLYIFLPLVFYPGFHTGWLKKVSCWFYVDMPMQTEKIGGTWTNTNNYRENEALSNIFTWNIFCQYFLCLNILWLKAVSVGTTIIAEQTRTRTLRKYDVITVCSIEYVTTEIGHRSCYLLFVCFVIFCNINGPTLLKYPPEYIAYFFEPPCM